MKYLIIPLLFLCSCGPTIHSDPIKVDPITVNHTISVDPTKVEQFYQSQCAQQFPNDQAAQQQCVNDSVNNFLKAFGFSTQP